MPSGLPLNRFQDSICKIATSLGWHSVSIYIVTISSLFRRRLGGPEND